MGKLESKSNLSRAKLISCSPNGNCEMSDLDQTELKQDVHYKHTKERDYWLFAWNPFDWTCRDKVNTIGGSRVNNDRRMDIFREPGKLDTLNLLHVHHCVNNHMGNSSRCSSSPKSKT